MTKLNYLYKNLFPDDDGDQRVIETVSAGSSGVEGGLSGHEIRRHPCGEGGECMEPGGDSPHGPGKLGAGRPEVQTGEIRKWNHRSLQAPTLVHAVRGRSKGVPWPESGHG